METPNKTKRCSGKYGCQKRLPVGRFRVIKQHLLVGYGEDLSVKTITNLLTLCRECERKYNRKYQAKRRAKIKELLAKGK